MKLQNITYSIPWNLFLISVGSLIVGIGLKAIVIPNGMITGGFSGAGIVATFITALAGACLLIWGVRQLKK